MARSVARQPPFGMAHLDARADAIEIDADKALFVDAHSIRPHEAAVSVVPACLRLRYPEHLRPAARAARGRPRTSSYQRAQGIRLGWPRTRAAALLSCLP